MKKTVTFLVLVVAAVGIGSGIGVAFPNSPEVSESETSGAVSEPSTGSSAQLLDSIEDESSVMSVGEDESVSFSGQVIAGSTTPYIRYNAADFDKARDEGKSVYLYYYATWCPICSAERPGIFGAFDELDREDIVGFEVHFNDGQNTREDDDVAREYGVFSQHTHVFLDKEGNVVQKSLTPLSKEQIKSTILNTV